MTLSALLTSTRAALSTVPTRSRPGRLEVRPVLLRWKRLFIDLSKKLVLYAQSGTETVVLPKLLAKNPLHAKERREAIRAYFAGERTDAARPASLPLLPIKRTAAHQPAMAHEGC